MKAEPVVAREFEYLVPQDVKGKPTCHPIGEESFAALRAFVLSNHEGDSPLELMRLCSPHGIGEAIQLQNYVGVIELVDGLQVEVLPKIDIAHDSGTDSRTVFARMLRELGCDLPFKSLERTGLSTGETPLFEVFVVMFLDEVTALVRRGLCSAYSTVESEERYVRGKIDFTREARKGGTRAEVVSLIHDELMADSPQNRLLKSTLMLLRRRSRDGRNVRLAARLLTAFEEVRPSSDVEGDLARSSPDRTTLAYGNAMAWCRVFLRGESFTMFLGNCVAFALLFPMERVFEDYVGSLLRRRGLKGRSLRHVEFQARGQWLFEGRRVGLRPDILCELRDGTRVVLDTKWKRINGVRDLMVSDLYQMYAYGQRYRDENTKVQHVVLLYPWHEGVDAGLMLKGRHVSRDGVQVDLFFFDLSKATDSVDTLIETLKELTWKEVG